MTDEQLLVLLVGPRYGPPTRCEVEQNHYYDDTIGRCQCGFVWRMGKTGYYCE